MPFTILTKQHLKKRLIIVYNIIKLNNNNYKSNSYTGLSTDDDDGVGVCGGGGGSAYYFSFLFLQCIRLGWKYYLQPFLCFETSRLTRHTIHSDPTTGKIVSLSSFLLFYARPTRQKNQQKQRRYICHDLWRNLFFLLLLLLLIFLYFVELSEFLSVRINNGESTKKKEMIEEETFE
ncbi:predicted protein [Lodderomyces elongisporus NRRL YB-4239]|uniref:Uncharacterized protein n=1 Tax=Lodderomyces elongisporus (strain ATCC 11503 / CBS 2605 / JCM 1781 / NBRC 1676 / NRRL YB-4239) TaxID=379508 RepID=A5E0Q2_LODEL|nr:predicted protein [Lodderomyces elongisporus NRRL YB-4239]